MDTGKEVIGERSKEETNPIKENDQIKWIETPGQDNEGMAIDPGDLYALPLEEVRYSKGMPLESKEGQGD